MGDDMVKAVAEGGGVVQINFGSGFVSGRRANGPSAATRRCSPAPRGREVSPEARRAFMEAYAAGNPYPFATVDTVLDHIDRVVELAGIDHVGLGSDFDGVGDTLPVGLKDVGDFPNLVAGLLGRGYEEDDIGKVLGLNLMRVWRDVEQYAEAQGRLQCAVRAASPCSTEPSPGPSRRYTPPMAFDCGLAIKLSNEGDRDVARFFAGREPEVRQFDTALVEAHERRQGVFRIFQGAPGCGKTSFATHLQDIRGDDALFVQVYEGDLAGPDVLLDKIKGAVVEAARGAKVAAMAARTLAAWLKIQPAGAVLDRALTGRAVARATVVLHVDEAQTLGEAEAEAIRWLHTGGLGIPAVCVFTGLSHTASRIKNLGGLSRLANNAVIDMGGMLDKDSVESTGMMMEALGVDCTADTCKQLPRLVAEESLGWPQHLHCAQQALCRELVRADGQPRDVDPQRIRTDAGQARDDYYLDRLDGTVLDNPRVLTEDVVGAVVREQPTNAFELTKLCRREIEAHGLDRDPDFDTTPGEYANLLVEKGVLAFNRRGPLDVAIPSMARWLGVQPA